MSDNYAEETKPLFKMLRTEAFRFVIVRYNHYDLVRQLEHDLKQRFSDRPFLKIDTSKADYYSLTQTYFSINRGFLFLENFDDVLKEQLDSQGKETPQYKIENERRRGITAGLNLRRDKLAKLPIALFVFVPASTGELYAKTIMEKMPDLWSFRSMILDLEKEIITPIAPIKDLPLTTSDPKIEIFKEDTTELNRLLALLENTPEHEIAYRLTLYPQIVKEAHDTGNYELALATLNAWENQVTDTEKAWIWIQKGDILRIYGQLEEALAIFEKAKDLAEGNKDKDSVALSCERLGDIYTMLGDLNKALLLFEQYNLLENELATNNPSKPIYKNNLAISYKQLGDTHSSLGNLDRALSVYNIANRIFEELYTTYPQNVNFKNSLAISYHFLGNTYTILGDLNHALSNYEKYNELSKELYEGNNQKVKFKNDYAISYAKLGDTYKSLGNLKKALDAYSMTNQMFEELYVTYPLNVEFKNSLAISYGKLGEAHNHLGHFDKALEFFEQRLKLTKQLYDAYPKNVSFKNSMAISYGKLGDMYNRLGNLEKALGYFSTTKQIFEELYAAHPQNVEFKNGLAILYKKLGAVSRDELKDNKQAKAYFQEAEKLWSELVRDAPQYAQFQQFLEMVQKDIKSLD